MANEAKVYRGTVYALETGGTTVAASAISAAATNAYQLATNGSGYPDGEFYLECAFGSAPADGAVISLYAQALTVDGTNDEQSPTATFLPHYIGSFIAKNNNATQRMMLKASNLPYNAKYYIVNSTAISTGAWKLGVYPMTLGPA